MKINPTIIQNASLESKGESNHSFSSNVISFSFFLCLRALAS